MKPEEARRFEHARIRYRGIEYIVQQVTERVIICKSVLNAERLELIIDQTPLYEITHLSS